MAGAEIACGIDCWDLAVQVYSDNFAGRCVQEEVGESSDPGRVSSYGPFDMVLASPECTSHTCARGNRPPSDKSRMTAMHVLKYLRYFRPRWAVVENVIHMKSWERYQELLASLEALGYHVRPQVLDASLFGVPQKRNRLFLLCDRERMPEAVSVPDTVIPAAKDILDPPGSWKSRPLAECVPATRRKASCGIRILGPGQDFLVVYYGSDAAGGWQPLDRPLRTLTTLDRFGLVHWEEGVPFLRMLQVPELKRAMGLGNDFILDKGSRRDRVKICGNGVCPPVMRHIVCTLAADQLGA